MKLPFTARLLCGGMSPPISTTEVAPVVVQDSVTGEPYAVDQLGLAVNDVIIRMPTVTVTLPDVEPVALVAVKVYVVVAEGVTDWQAVAARFDPILLMEIEVALVTCQQIWLDWPAEMFDGTAVNELICGTVAGTTETVIGELTDWPVELVAVNV